MKRLISYCVALAAIATVTTGCPPPDTPPDPNVFAVNFTEAEIEYCFDELENGTGNWELWFYREEAEDDYTELYLDLVSDYYEDGFQAVMAAGSYSYSTSHSKFTITEESCFYGLANAENIGEVEIKGGTVEIIRTGANYSFVFNLELEGGKILKCSYNGDYYQEGKATLTSNVTIDTSDEWSTDVEATMERDGLWAIMMDIDASLTKSEFVVLMINTETGITTLPTGEFPMANAPRLGVAGSAEPTFMPDTWEGTGCIYGSYDENTGKEQFSWAVPNKGFVNITEIGEYRYTIEFSFEDPNGYTVSGEYSGFVDIYGPETSSAREKPVWRALSPAKHQRIPRRLSSAE